MEEINEHDRHVFIDRKTGFMLGSSINTLGYQDAFNFMSTGGGATLEYIANKRLNCFDE